MRTNLLASVLLSTTLLTGCNAKRAAQSDKNYSAVEQEHVAYGMAAPTTTAMADPAGGEAYHDWGKNPWVDADKDRLSTFAADVDTASFSIARSKLESGTLPPAASIRVEEFVNYFRYKFPSPTPSSPFSVVMEAAPSPIQAGSTIVRAVP